MGNWILTRRSARRRIDHELEGAGEHSFPSDSEAPLPIARELLLLVARGELTLRVGIGPRESELFSDAEAGED